MTRTTTVAFAAVLLAGCADRGGTAMSTEHWPVRYISIAIDRSPGQVYEIASRPENLPRWAQGLAGAIKPNADGSWAATSPMGEVTVRFASNNPYGVLDHDVTLPSGETVHNPMRVVPNARGSEVAFTLFRRPGTTDAAFEKDAAAVTRDLAALKALVER
jgi:hypothetical protein